MLARISELKRKKNAVILAHNYQLPEVQDLADFTGDSLELSRKAAGLDSELIVFCGVQFMAETAAVLAPAKTVLLPEREAGCPMADMITGRDLKLWKGKYPGLKVVCYVNTTAEVKAESDICCTSANAAKVVASLGEKEVLFVPDRNLAAYVAGKTGVKAIAWDGYCYVHDRFEPADFIGKKAAHPEAEIWVHPECRPEVTAKADKVLSTGGMVAEAGRTSSREVIIGTENGIIHRLLKENPTVRFLPAREDAICFDMKKTTVEKVLTALEEEVHRVTIPEDVAVRARRSIEAMLAVS